MLLTIAIPTHDDFDGLYFSLQSLRIHHDLSNCEIVVVDNTPNKLNKVKDAAFRLCKSADARYINDPSISGPANSKERAIQEAKGDFFLCLDSHVMLPGRVLTLFKEYLYNNQDSDDLLQGPLLYDSLDNIATHFDPKWRDNMYGVWGKDKQVELDQPFEIPMQGMGMFAMRKEAWPGFNPHFRGFGGEEGYIHSKVRNQGGKTLCLPFFRWIHRFERPRGVPYKVCLKDRFFNYILGRMELEMDFQDVIEHFTGKIPQTSMSKLLLEAQALNKDT